MKKILISILIILTLVLAYISFSKGVNIGFLKINSIENIKLAKIDLDQDFNTANHLTNITYPEETEKLETAITNLKTTKQDYQNKSSYNVGDNSIGTVQVKTYTIHYLWTVLGNYRKDRNVKSLNLDLKAGQGQDIYNLEFTLIGNYVGITDFIYDIENDEELNFEIENLRITSQIGKVNNNAENSSNATSNSTSSDATQTSDGKLIQATFTVKNVGITLE